MKKENYELKLWFGTATLVDKYYTEKYREEGGSCPEAPRLARPGTKWGKIVRRGGWDGSSREQDWSVGERRIVSVSLPGVFCRTMRLAVRRRIGDLPRHLFGGRRSRYSVSTVLV